MNALKTAIVSAGMVMLTASWAGAWAVHCQNGSCTASSGKVQVYWQASSDNDIYRNIVLRGVEGLPFSAEDFESEERKLDQTIEKSISRDAKSSAGMDASGSPGHEGAGGGAKLGAEKSSGIGLAKKRSQSLTDTQGGKVTVNYTLAFFKTFSDNSICAVHYRDGDVNRYLCGAEVIMDDYTKTGGEKVREEMVGYIFGRKANKVMPAVNLANTTTPANNELQTVKYAALSRFPAGSDQRWQSAYRYVQNAASGDKSRDEFNKNFIADKTSLALMLKPGITASKLESNNKHIEAVAKWIADSNRIHFEDPIFSGITSLTDRYMAAIGFAKYAPEDLRKQLEVDFAKAKTSRDKLLDAVTVPINWGKRIAYGVAGLLAVCTVLAAVVVFKRKRQQN